jgi:RNA polymerase-binding transcription factor DksA
MTTTPARSTVTPDPTDHRFPVAGPTANPATPSARRFPAAGPAVNLVEIPDSAEVALTSPSEIDTHLAEIETARRKQLDALPEFNRDTVTAAYRATVERILADVRAARALLAAGRYGICSRCHSEIPAQRLERRPWVAMCTPCARLDDA